MSHVETSSGQVTVIDHPVVQALLSELRSQTTTPPAFRRLARQLASLMAFEITRGLDTRSVPIETPMGRCDGRALAGPITLVPILRAGLGLLDGVLDLLPSARVGHVGLYRDEASLQPIEYYSKFPGDIAESTVLVLDPMLATAGSLNAALDIIKRTGATTVRVLCLVAAPQGLAALAGRHPDVPVFTGAIDSTLDENGYIVPGLGDAGDRLYGTA